MRLLSLIAALLAAVFAASYAGKARAGLFVSITVAPPALPVYVQPPIPGPGYMWTPGFWSWDEDTGDYYWVPGAWVAAPEPGLLWTPGYWGWSNGVYAWNTGYWGPRVGFYGGVSYGFGYTGVGFAGGYWSGGVFAYNRAVINVGGPGVITNVYNKTVIVNNTTNVSFNGGNGGIRAQPTAEQLAAGNERRHGPSPEQVQHQQLAAKNPDLKYANNKGKPSIAATTKAGDFSKGHVFAAKSAGGAGLNPASAKTNSLQGGTSPNAKRTGTNPVQGTNNSNAKRAGTNPGFKPLNNTGSTARTGTPSGFRGGTGGGNYPPKNAAINQSRRPPPKLPPKPAPRPAVKQPANNVKKPG
jgi:WXXGXW repeat (2 copies)